MIKIQPIDSAVKPNLAYSLCSNLQEFALIIAQTAIRVLFILSSILMTVVVLPTSFHPIVIPFVAFGATILSSFFFLEDQPQNPALLEPIQPLLKPVVAGIVGDTDSVSAEAPRGLVNNQSNCAFNSLIHFLESDPAIASSLRNLIPVEEDMSTFEEFLKGYDLPDQLIHEFKIFHVAQARPIRDSFKDFLDQHVPNSAHFRAFRKIQDAYRTLYVLEPALTNFYHAYDQAVRDNHRIAGGNTQSLRLALSRITNDISPSESRQEDPSGPLMYILDAMPDRLKMKIEESIHYDTRRLPAIAGHEDALSIKDELQTFFTVEFKEGEKNANLEQMFNYYSDHKIARSSGSKGVLLTGVDGKLHHYQADHATRTLTAPPSALRFMIKRFVEQPGGRFFSKTRTVKKNDSVDIPQEIEIRMTQGRRQRYRLASFVNHHGNSKEGGHYTAAREINGQKYFMSDTEVTPVNQRAWDERRRLAYLLCYLPIQAQ